MKKVLFYISGILTLLWGTTHLFPTAGVVEGFGDISLDNKLIITMEWIVEGLTLIFLGFLTLVVTITDPDGKLARRVLLMIAVLLLSLAILSLFTGFRVDFLPYKLCPIIFSVSAILIVAGIVVKSNET
jgi:hypothetical protein